MDNRGDHLIILTATGFQKIFPSYQPETFTQRQFQAHKAKLHQLDKYSQLVATIDTEDGSNCCGLHNSVKNSHKAEQPAECKVEPEALPT